MTAAFRLESARTASTRASKFMPWPPVPGFGLGWAELNPDADKPAADIGLRPEQIIRGRLVELSGQPAAGCRARGITRPRSGIGPRDPLGPLSGASLMGRSRRRSCRAWPQPSTTDARRTLHARMAVGRDLTCAASTSATRDSPPDDSRSRRTTRRRPKRGHDGRCNPQRSSRAASSPADTGQPIPARHRRGGHRRRGRPYAHHPISCRRSRKSSQPTLRQAIIFASAPRPPDGQPYLVGLGRDCVDQGGSQEGDRPRPSPRRLDPR